MDESNFIQPSALAGLKMYVEYAALERVPDLTNKNGIWIPTGFHSTRVTLKFGGADEGKISKSKSEHWVTVFGNAKALAEEKIPKGVELKIGAMYEFFTTPTVYANGKTYDVITARRVPE